MLLAADRVAFDGAYRSRSALGVALRTLPIEQRPRSSRIGIGKPGRLMRELAGLLSGVALLRRLNQ